jgi:hypothetical protein
MHTEEGRQPESVRHDSAEPACAIPGRRSTAPALARCPQPDKLER